MEAFILIFVIWHLRKNIISLSPNSHLNNKLKVAMIAIAILFILEINLSISLVTNWIWHLLILATGFVIFKLRLLDQMRTILIAFLPLVVLNLTKDLFKIIYLPLYEKIDDYLNFGVVFSIAWMIAMLIRSSKQNKALLKEKQKTLAEEERSKFISAQKEQLELIVEERTAEITKQKDELMQAFNELKNAQSQLVQAEKMASLGELTAGIAHEIQNPLNFVNNFSEISSELIDEMHEEVENGDLEEARLIASDIKQNLEKIRHHGKRADAIVKGMLQHSRKSTAQKEQTDINKLAEEYLRLAYHGFRTRDKSFNATLKTDFDDRIGLISVIPQDIGRVILNLITNAFYAVNEHKNHLIKEKRDQGNYKPTVTVRTKKLTNIVEIVVKDNGSGIPIEVLDKIFQPFFTTKPAGQGTGLGLSMSYDIITKGHKGELRVKSSRNTGTKFIVLIPIIDAP